MGNRGNESPSLILLSFIFFFQIIANTIFVACEEDPGVSVGSSLLTDTPEESCYSSARVLTGPQSPFRKTNHEEMSQSEGLVLSLHHHECTVLRQFKSNKSEVRCGHNKLKMKTRSMGHVGIDQLGVQEAKNDSEASN